MKEVVLVQWEESSVDPLVEVVVLRGWTLQVFVLCSSLWNSLLLIVTGSPDSSVGKVTLGAVRARNRVRCLAGVRDF